MSRLPDLHPRFISALWLAVPAVALAGLTLPLAAAPAPAARQPVQFRREIRPLFVERCVACHGPQRQDGGLRLDLRSRALPAVTPVRRSCRAPRSAAS